VRKLPRFVVYGGRVGGGDETLTSEVLRLYLGVLRWELQLNLTTVRADHACCAVRRGVVVLGGFLAGDEPNASVEILGRDSSGAVENIFKILSPLSWGPMYGSAAVVIDESESDQGQVLPIGDGSLDGSTAVHHISRSARLTRRLRSALPSRLSFTLKGVTPRILRLGAC
jgi:hypothetical protein